MTMNQSKIQDMLLDLKAKQYIDSEVTHTLSQDNVPLVSISYSKTKDAFQVQYTDNQEMKLFTNVGAAMCAITTELDKHR